MPRKANKRVYDEDDEFDNDVASCLQGIGSDLKKVRQSKAERMNQYAEESIKSTLEPLMDVIEKQAEERRNMFDKFYDDVHNLLQQEDNYLMKMKKWDHDMQKLTRMQKKTAQGTVQFESENFEKVKQTSENFFQNLDEMLQIHIQQLAELRSPLSEEFLEHQEEFAFGPQKSTAANMKAAMNFWAM